MDEIHDPMPPEESEALREMTASHVMALDIADVFQALSEARSYRAMTYALLALLPGASQEAIDRAVEPRESLRGFARIGLMSADKDEAGQRLHDDTMEVLAAAGLEPLSEEVAMAELRRGAREAAAHLMAQAAAEAAAAAPAAEGEPVQ